MCLGEYVGLPHEKFRPIEFQTICRMLILRNAKVVGLFPLSLVEFRDYQCPLSVVASISGPLSLLLRPMLHCGI